MKDIIARDRKLGNKHCPREIFLDSASVSRFFHWILLTVILYILEDIVILLFNSLLELNSAFFNTEQKEGFCGLFKCYLGID